MESTAVELNTTADTGKEVVYARFSGSHAKGGDLLSVTVDASADMDSGTSFSNPYFYVTTVVEHDYGTLPNLGFSTGSYHTSSHGLLL